MQPSVSSNGSTVARVLEPARLLDRVAAYWLRPGGELSLGICRIFIYFALLHGLLNNFNSPEAVASFLSAVDPANYAPKGILKLLGTLPVDPAFSTALWYIAFFCGLAAIVGICTRPAMIAASLSTLVLVTLKEGWSPLWSHMYVVLFYTSLPFMFGAAGSTLSVDRMLRRRLPAWPFGAEVRSDRYYWPVLAAQLGAASFYFGAFWAKVVNGGWVWAFSDNMRMMLAITWEHPYHAVPTPWYIDLVSSHPLLWQGASIIHLATQALPLLAVFSIRRPLLRLCEGLVFLAGIIALELVMDIVNRQWMWLTVLFIDWEWLAAKARGASPAAARTLARLTLALPSSFVLGRHGGNTVPPVPVLGRQDWLVLSYLLAFFGYFWFVFLLQQGEKHRNYPFSSLSFYSAIYVSPPYNQHTHHTFMAGGIRFPGGQCPGPEDRAFTCREGVLEFSRKTKQLPALYEFYRVETVGEVGPALRSIKRYVEAAYPGAIGASADVALTTRFWQYPPYPGPITPVINLEALRGVLKPDGRVITAIGKAVIVDGEYRVTVEHAGFTHPKISLQSRHDAWHRFGAHPAVEVQIRWIDDKTFAVPKGAVQLPGYTTLVVQDEGTTERYEFWGPILY